MLNRIPAFDFPFYYIEKINEYEKANKYLLEILRQEKKENPKGRLISNRGGYQTDHIWEHELFHKFGQILSPYINELKDEIRMKKGYEIVVDGAWINENKGFNFNVPHLHPNCHFAVVYYIEFPKNSGEILFLNPNKSASMSGLIDVTDCSHYRHDLAIVPKTGSLIIFPSYFEHCVLQGDNIDTRITCAFNMSLRKINESN
jgi:uncharacterized protein (TIGR02466 family)